MSFKTHEDYLDYKKSLSEFLWKEVEPLASEIDEHDHVPWGVLLPYFRKWGLFGLIIPEQYGGLGLTTSQYLPVLAELAKVSGAIRVLLHLHHTSARALDKYGRESRLFSEPTAVSADT